MFFKSDFVLNGELGEFEYASSKNSKVTKYFCLKCGSPIYGHNTHNPEYVTLSLGTIDNAADLKVQVVVFARDKQHWDAVDEKVISFETQPDWKPGSS